MHEFQLNPLGVSVGKFISNNGLQFQTCKSIELIDIVHKAIFLPRKYNIPGREKSCGTKLNGCFETLRKNYLKKINSNVIVHVFHFPIFVHKISRYKGHK